jgi:hypothetical protein
MQKPSITVHQYNALAMFMFNDTSQFVQQHFTSDDHHFVWKMACAMDSSHLEQKQKAQLIAHRNDKVVQR